MRKGAPSGFGRHVNNGEIRFHEETARTLKTQLGRPRAKAHPEVLLEEAGELPLRDGEPQGKRRERELLQGLAPYGCKRFEEAVGPGAP